MIPLTLAFFVKIIESILILSVAVTLAWYLRYYSFQRYMKRFPQIPNMVPLFGNCLEFPTTVDVYYNLKKYHGQLGPNFWAIFGIEPILFVTDPKLVEIILSSPKYIEKSRSYYFFHKWLGQGLLTSGGQKWKKHRKILTPAFHFKILEGFVDSFDSTSDVLVKKLNNEIGKDATDVYPLINLSSLDSLCESAMGTIVNAQDNKDSPYVKSVRELARIIVDRTIRPMENFDLTYRFTKNYRIEKKALKIVHDYTDAVIAKRRKAILSTNESLNNTNDFGIKTKIAFLDLLLQYNDGGNFLSNKDIRDEVDTFMFEGHDTTSSTLSFTIYMLANNPAIQSKAFEELAGILNNDRDRKITFDDLHQMKYLELVIKETLRMYPAVPAFGRQLYEDVEYDGKTLPKGLTVFIVPYLMHLDKEHFPNPETFEPERFLPENIEGKHPYSYTPFSAGPRNCIGQKFAMLAIKSTVSKILRNFQLLPVKHDVVLAVDSVLTSKNGIMVQIKKRKW